MDNNGIDGVTTPNTQNTQAPEKDYKQEYEKQLMEIEKLKNAISKTNSENAEYKKRELAKMSDDEKRQKEYQDLVESANQMKAELESIKLEKEFMSEGFTSEETSKLMKSNFSAKSIAEIVKAKVEEAVKSAQAEWVKDTTPPPNLDNGKSGDGSQKTDFQKRQEERFGNQPNKIVKI